MPRSRSGSAAGNRFVPAAADGPQSAAAMRLAGDLDIGGLEFMVRVSPRRRSLGITVDRDGSLLLHAPAGTDLRALSEWVWSKRAWVFRKLAEKDLLLSPSPRKDFVNGEGFDYLGRHYRLQLTPDPPARGVSLQHGRLHMPRSIAEAGDGAAAVIRWYRRRAFAWLPPRIAAWAGRMGLHPGGLDVRDLGYRWGSLGKNDRFNIHWATMQLPVSLVDYVIVHELAHIAEPGHTPAFWAAVQRALPDHDQRRARLAITGATLWLG